MEKDDTGGTVVSVNITCCEEKEKSPFEKTLM